MISDALVPLGSSFEVLYGDVNYSKTENDQDTKDRIIHRDADTARTETKLDGDGVRLPRYLRRGIQGRVGADSLLLTHNGRGWSLFWRFTVS